MDKYRQEPVDKNNDNRTGVNILQPEAWGRALLQRLLLRGDMPGNNSRKQIS